MTFFLIYAATCASTITILVILGVYKRYKTNQIIKILEELQSDDIKVSSESVKTKETNREIH